MGSPFEVSLNSEYFSSLCTCPCPRQCCLFPGWATVSWLAPLLPNSAPSVLHTDTWVIFQSNKSYHATHLLLILWWCPSQCNKARNRIVVMESCYKKQPTWILCSCLCSLHRSGMNSPSFPNFQVLNQSVGWCSAQAHLICMLTGCPYVQHQ